MVHNLLADWSDRSALLDQLASRFPVAREVVEIGGLQLEIFSVANVHDQIDLLMGEVVGGDYQWEPFWAQAWPSARRLVDWMLEENRRQSWAGRRVLDLGCGVGLCGCVAAAVGAEVTLADYAEPAVWFAAANAWPWRERASTIVFDWHKDVLSDKFDVILGADIVYEQRNWAALLRFFDSYLSDAGQIVLTEPGRDTGETFQNYLRPHGWRIESSVLSKLENNRPLRLLLAQR
ncbi:MAG: methyltransferase domain-containing protein [Pirellulaceae bacterium]|nr:methyltransferase domain-containing protein [Pirellulaceae bacterium]